MVKKVLDLKLLILFFAINLLIVQVSFGQSDGDYRSKNNGSGYDIATWEIYDDSISDWRPATAVDGVPGAIVKTNKTYVVTILHDVSLAGLDLFSGDQEPMGEVIIYGTLTFGDASPRVYYWNGTGVTIEAGGEVIFANQKTELHMPANAVLTIKPTGLITGACSNNTEIYLGDELIAVCKGGGGKVLTFSQLVDSGGSLDSEIYQPVDPNSTACINQPITLEGGYVGGAVGPVNYEWVIYDSALVPILSSVTTAATFTPSALGLYYITLSVSDNNSTNVETHIVTVEDNEDPTVTAATDVSVGTDVGVCESSIVITDATFGDNCSSTLTWVMTGAVTASGSGQVGTYTFPTGTTTITYTNTDGVNTDATDAMTVTVVDNEDPTIVGLPANISVNNDAGVCGATVTWVEPTASDNCPGSTIAQTLGAASGTIFPIGTTTITYTATDAASRTHSESFTITVTDNEDPTASNPPPVTVECIDEIPVNIAVVTDEADNCTINPIVTHVSDVSDGNTCPEIITRTYNISDGNGNSINVTQTITINDITNPSFTKPADITIYKTTTCTYDASLSFTGDVTNEDDNCSTNLNATFSDSINDVSLGETIITRTWSLVDDCGNSAADQIQIITVEDNINPVAICQPITVAVDEVFTGAQINNGSTDNCGIEFYSLDRTSFNCTEVGDQTVTLTVTDYNGNSSTCDAIVTVLPTNINGGNVTGHNYFTNGDPDGPEGTLVNVTACPENEIKNAHLTITGNDGTINTWQYSYDGGVIWNDVAGDPSSFSFTNVGKTEMDYMNILKTTLFRVKIDVGSCVGYSPTMLVQVIPPDIKPSIDFDTAYICIGDDITVNASSEYANNILLDEGGLFNQANPEGWRLNYVVGEGEIKFPASADNEDVSIWAETNGPKDFGSLTYDTSDNTKFAIAFGDFSGEKYGSTTWNETWTTMETPIFDSRGLEELYIVFDQAYYLEAGASIKIEISTDGGVTYPADINPLDPGYNSVTGAAHNYTGPSTSGTGTHNGGFVHTLIDLTDDYLGQSNLRVRFTFEGGGTTNSSWAIDNISVPDQHVDEVIEWTDEFGNIITYGFTATITPVSPGHQHIGATSLIDQCRSVDDIGTQRIEVFVDYAYAGTDLVSDVSGDGECGETSVILNAYDNEKSSNENKLDDAWDDSNGFTLSDIPGSVYSGMPGTFEGTWTAVPNLTCAASTLLDFSFSDIHDPKSTFTGEAGDYTLTWTTVRTLPDGSQKICTDDMNVTITNCAGVNFDGNNDYVDFKATNYNLTNQDFSIEAWIRPDINSTQIQTVFSKRNANNLGGLGYDLRLTDRIISFNWMNGGNISSPYQIDNDRWYHVGVTFDGGTYKLYIDGIEVASKSGQALLETDFDCMLGAMDDVNLSFPYGIAKNFFNGSMDEVRIWNVALTENQLRETMNQEINDDGSGGVIGAKVPILIDGLIWSDLEGYYRMDESCGFLTPTSGVINGKLRNIFDDQVQNAPIPYTSNTGVNGQNWNTDNTWTHFDVWDPPNSLGVDGTRIDWNIVEISNDINSAEAGGIEGITLLGLISNSGELTMAANGAMDETNSGRMLWITHYLKLNGSIDLVGESQLLQKKYGYYNDPPFNHNYITTQLSESILDEDSTGYIERDQQGQGNLYNYDFRSSPVDNFGTVSPFDEDSSTYTIKGVMFDGINVTASDEPKEITFNTLHDGNASTNPIQISTRWLYLNRSAASWTRICPTCAIKIGEGFTFKGSIDPLVSSDSQNFVFKGKPNNGTFNNLTIGTNWDSYLVGNPYPSAMDADQFIIDNGSIIQGAVYYYHDFGTDNTHLTTKASYGYAIYSLAGSVQAINRRPENGPNGGKLPARYIPVVQGFWVYGLNGGTLKFNNNQRAYVTEADPLKSMLFKAAKSKKSAQEGAYKDTRTKIRIGFNAEEYINRQILLTIDARATDSIDHGFDAGIFMEIPNDNDMYWTVNNQKLAIQAVGDLFIDRVVPIGVKTRGDGLLKIKVDSIENPYPNMEVFLRDNLTMDTYDIKNETFEISLAEGEYNEQYSVVFKAKEETPIEVEEIFSLLNVFVNENNTLIKIQKPEELTIQEISLFNAIGQQLKIWNTNFNKNEINLPINVASGIYLVHIKTNNGNNIKKIIIN